MSDRNDMERFLETLSAPVQRAVEIITPHDVMGGVLFHISTNTNIKKFVPIIGMRQAKTEDRTVPRVCTAPTLIGCIAGYAAAEHDFRSNIPNGEKEFGSYKGGYKIYGFDFKHALRPKKSLVYDQNVTDECWLVAYNKDSSSYEPVTFGKVFISAISMRARADRRPYYEIEMYVEISHDLGVRFSKNQHLTKGYWKIIGPEQRHISSWKDDKNYTFEQISKADYFAMKTLSAGLLSYEDPLPNFIKW